VTHTWQPDERLSFFHIQRFHLSPSRNHMHPNQQTAPLKSALLPQHVVQQPHAQYAAPVMGIVINDATGRVQRLSRSVVKIATFILILNLVRFSSITGVAGLSTITQNTPYATISLVVPILIFYCATAGVKQRSKSLICCFTGWSLFFSIVIAILVVFLVVAYSTISEFSSDYKCHTVTSLDSHQAFGTCVCCRTSSLRLLQQTPPQNAASPSSSSSGNLTTTGYFDDDIFSTPTPSPFLDDDLFKAPTPSPFSSDDDLDNDTCVAVNSALSGACDSDYFGDIAHLFLIIIVVSSFSFMLWCCAFCKGCALYKEPYFNVSGAAAPQYTVYNSGMRPPVVASAVPASVVANV
jgi:hypothetical protein